RSICLISPLVFVSDFASARDKLTLSGYVRDANSGEKLIAAVFGVRALNLSTYSNNYMFYSISLPEGQHEIEIYYVGYATKEEEIEVNSSKRHNFELVSNSSVIEEIVVTGKKEDDHVTSAQMGNLKFSMEELKNIPVLFGEKDVLK